MGICKVVLSSFFRAGRDDEKDHDPRKLLAGLARTLKRRTLRDWDIFMMCDEDEMVAYADGISRQACISFSFRIRHDRLKRLWEAIDLDHSEAH